MSALLNKRCFSPIKTNAKIKQRKISHTTKEDSAQPGKKEGTPRNSYTETINNPEDEETTLRNIYMQKVIASAQ